MTSRPPSICPVISAAISSDPTTGAQHASCRLGVDCLLVDAQPVLSRRQRAQFAQTMRWLSCDPCSPDRRERAVACSRQHSMPDADERLVARLPQR